jgi:hypothetical protein
MGLVVDDEDVPVIGAAVVLDAGETSVTDVNGEFFFAHVPTGSHIVQAKDASRTSRRRAFRTDEAQLNLVLRLEPRPRVELSVMNGEDGSALPEASVHLRPVGRSGSLTLHADERGLATAVVDAGMYEVTAEAAGFAPRSVSITAHPANVASTLVVLVPGVSVAGIAVDTAGRPVAGAEIVAQDAAAIDGTESVRYASTHSDERGRWRFESLRAGTFRFRATRTGFAPATSAPTRIERGRAQEALRVTLTRGRALAGTVVDAADEPVAGAEVRASAAVESGSPGAVRSVSTDDDGRFELIDLPPGEVELMAARGSAVSRPIVVRGDAGEPRLRLDVQGQIAGRLVSSDGASVAGVSVEAVPLRPVASRLAAGFQTAVSDAQGQFTLSGLTQDEYLVRVAEGAVAWDRPREGKRAAVGTRDVELTYDAPGEIEGWVSFRDGSLPDLVRVHVDGSPPLSTSDGGTFRLTGVAPGPHSVTVSGPSFETRVFRDVVVEPGLTSNVGEVLVERGMALLGAVVDAQGLPVPGAVVLAADAFLGDSTRLDSPSTTASPRFRSAPSARDGSFRLEGLSREPIWLMAEHPSRGRSEPVRVDPGSGESSLLRIGAKAQLVGEVLRGEGSAAFAVVAAQRMGGDGTSTATITLGAVADAEGRFYFDSLPAGEYLVTAMPAGGRHAAGAQSKRVSVSAGSVEVQLRLPAEEVVELVVRRAAEDAPLPARLLLAGRFTYVASFGRGPEARFEGVTPGHYMLCAIFGPRSRQPDADDCVPLTVSDASRQEVSL